MRLRALAAAGIIAVLVTSGVTVGSHARAASQEATYRVTLENLTSGQPFSPPIFVTHGDGVHLWRLDEQASNALRLIAEDGDNAELARLLAGSTEVDDVQALDAPVLPGKSVTVELVAAPGSRLSLATMLICTNDGFTGLDTARIPSLAPGKGGAFIFWADAYDAGTEVSTERTPDLVDPCGVAGPVQFAPDGNARTPSSDPIMHHAGIKGTGDLTQAHAWRGPVAKLTVERIK